MERRLNVANIRRLIWSIALLLLLQISYFLFTFCQTVPSNEAIKPPRLQDHLQKEHGNKMDKDLDLFKVLKDYNERRATVTTIF